MQSTSKPRKPRRQRVPAETWRGLRLAFVAGGALRQLARDAGISEGTILARASREGWTQQRHDAVQRARGGNGSNAGSEDAETHRQQSLAIMTAEQVQEAHLVNMLALGHRLSSYASQLPDETAFTEIRRVDCMDRMVRRRLGIDKAEPLISFGFFSSQPPDPASLGVVIDDETEETETPMLEN